MCEKVNKNEPQELTKYGVSCKCAAGDRPKSTELVKIAGVIGKSRCPCCGSEWLDSDTIEPSEQS
jgi:hypothetical protein